MALCYFYLGAIARGQGNTEQGCRLLCQSRDLYAELGFDSSVETIEKELAEAGCIDMG